ncbi:MAG: glycoside hydrolase family 2 TIM barrel-domain containing protein [Calditrichia bacterium]
MSLILFLLCLGAIAFADSVSVPAADAAKKSEAARAALIKEENPVRRIVFLNKNWTILNPSNGERRGELRVPFSFNGESKLLLQTEFDVTFQPGEEVRLHLGSLNGAFAIRLNDSTIARDAQRYLPFDTVLPQGILKNGANSLQILLADNSKSAADKPLSSLINLPRLNVGIFTSSYLSIAPRYRIQNLIAGIRSDSSSVLFGSLALNHPLPDSLGFRISMQILSANGSIFRQEDIATAGESKFELPTWNLDALPVWTPENPNLYTLEIRLVNADGDIDVIRRRLAVRDTRLKRQLLEKDLSLKGLNYVYQTPDGAGWFDVDLVRRDLEDMKARGYNAVRVVYHTLPEQFYRICDELGLYCLQDLPIVFAGISSDSRNIPREWTRGYARMTDLSRRYSSLLAVGVAYNINAESKLQWNRFAQFLKQLNDLPVMRYISTYNLPPVAAAKIDFQLLEMVDRNSVQESLALLSAQGSLRKSTTIMPSGFSRPLTYRIDSEFLVADSLQIGEMERELNTSADAFGYPGYFARTYNDFYTQHPSLQNGILPRDRTENTTLESFFRSRVGLVDLTRSDKMQNAEGSFRLDNPTLRGMISEGKSVHSFLYIFVGILNLFFFLILYKRFKIFRQNVHYSIKKPHGFFVNLQERISVPYKQSFFLLVVIALNAALVYSAVAFYYRYDLRLDYLLSFFVSNPGMKATLSELIWNQPQLLIFGTITIAVIFILLALPIKLLSLFSQSRVPFSQAIAASIWSAAPFAILLPLGIFMYNILIAVKSYWILIGVLLYFHAWYYLRWVNGTRVLTDKLYSRVFLLFSIVGLLLLAGIGYYYYSSGNILEHLNLLESLSEAFK